MKKLLIPLFVCIMFTSLIYCQDYNKFKLGLGLGYAAGSDATSFSGGGGILLTLEPAYRVNDNLAVGLRLEVAAYGSLGVLPGGFGSITVNTQYNLDIGQIRPFVGVGLGIYSQSESLFGFYPRLGFDWGHFTFALEYNLIPNGFEDYDYQSDSIITSSAYYFGVRVGGFFFGGKN